MRALVVDARTQPVVNYATNPSGGSTGGWNTNSGAYPATWDETVRRHGPRSRRSSAANPNFRLLSLYSTGATSGTGIPVPGAAALHACVWMRAEVPASGGIGASWLVAGTWTPAVRLPLVSLTMGSWTPVRGILDAPAGVTALRILAEVDADTVHPPGTYAWATDAMVTTHPYPIDHADGDTPGWRWDGTPHASASRGRPTLL